MDGHHRGWEGFVVEIVSRYERKTVFFLRRMLGTPATTLALTAQKVSRIQEIFYLRREIAVGLQARICPPHAQRIIWSRSLALPSTDKNWCQGN